MRSIILHIEPVAKGRPRFDRSGHAYTPSSTRKFENDVRKIVAQYRNQIIEAGPIKVTLRLFMIPPKRKVRNLPCVKPDWDNLAKSVTDALNGYLWRDDGQIVDVHVQKLYDWTARKGRIEIEMEEIGS